MHNELPPNRNPNAALALGKRLGVWQGMVKLDAEGLPIHPHGRPLTRMIARAFDAHDQTKAQHSASV